MFFNNLKTEKDEEFKEFWKDKMKNITFTFDQYDKIDNLLELFVNLADSLKLTSLSSFWENTTLKLLADYKMKFLSETMIYYLTYKDNDTEPLRTLLERNKRLLSLINVKDTDIKIMFILLHSCLNKCCDKKDYLASSFNTSLGSISNNVDDVNKSAQKDDNQKKSFTKEEMLKRTVKTLNESKKYKKEITEIQLLTKKKKKNIII